MSMKTALAVIVLIALSGCVVPRQEISICNVKEACTIKSDTTVEPMQLPKVIP